MPPNTKKSSSSSNSPPPPPPPEQTLNDIIRYDKDMLISINIPSLAELYINNVPPPDFFHPKQLHSPQPSSSTRQHKSRSGSKSAKPDSDSQQLPRRNRNRSNSPSKNRASNSTSQSSRSYTNSDSWINRHGNSTGQNSTSRTSTQQQSNRDFVRDFSALRDRRISNQNHDSNVTLERYSEWESEHDQRNDDTFGEAAGTGDFDFGSKDFDPIASYKAEMRARNGERHLGDAPDAIATFRKLMVSANTDIPGIPGENDSVMESDLIEPLNALNVDEGSLEEVHDRVENHEEQQSGPQGKFGRLFVDMDAEVAGKMDPVRTEMEPRQQAASHSVENGPGSDQFQFLMSQLTKTTPHSGQPANTDPVYPARPTSPGKDPRLETSPSNQSFTSQQPLQRTDGHQSEIHNHQSQPMTPDQLYQQQIMHQRQQQMIQQAHQVAAAAAVAAAGRSQKPQELNHHLYEDPVIQSQRRQHQFMLQHHQHQLGSVPNAGYPTLQGSGKMSPPGMTGMSNEHELMDAMVRERMAKKKAAALVAAANQMPTSVRRQQAAQHLPRSHNPAAYPMQHVQQGRAHAQVAMLDQLRNRTTNQAAYPMQQQQVPMMNPAYAQQYPARPRAPLPTQAVDGQNPLYSFVNHGHPMHHQPGSRTPPMISQQAAYQHHQLQQQQQAAAAYQQQYAMHHQNMYNPGYRPYMPNGQVQHPMMPPQHSRPQQQQVVPNQQQQQMLNRHDS